MSIPIIITTWVSPLHDAKNGDSCSGCRQRKGKSCKLFGRLKTHQTRKRDHARHLNCIRADSRARTLHEVFDLPEDLP